MGTREDVRNWIIAHFNEYNTRSAMIRAASEVLGKHYDTIYRYVKDMEEEGLISSKPRSSGVSVPSTIYKLHTDVHSMKINGIPRQETVLRYDIPAKLTHRLKQFIDSMESGFFYEEIQVQRACNVAKIEQEYWKDITSLREFAQYTGLTENNSRLWGTIEDIQWGVENMTGFRRVV